MRLSIQKTLKMYVGGKFIRSESGRITHHINSQGESMNVPRASRKDLRDSIETARSAQGPWAARTAYNRGQILYRLAEMMESRSTTLPTTESDLIASIDRVVHYAGWTDKITAVLSSLNPVGMAYVNYSMVRPLGVVFAVPNPKDGLLGLIDAICVPLLMGDAVVVMASTETSELAAALTEAMAVSDLPGGIANVLMGDIDEVLAVASRHDDVDGLYLFDGAVSSEMMVDCEIEAARVMRRILTNTSVNQPATPVQMAALSEVQTVWMSSGGNLGSGGKAY